MAEYLDHLKTFDEFFNISVGCADAFLLLAEVFCAAFAEEFDNHKRNHKHYDDKQRENRAQIQHHRKSCNNYDNRRNKLNKALAYAFTQGVNVAGEACHKLAVGMSIKKFEGQFLHVIEQVTADNIERFLRNLEHDS